MGGLNSISAWLDEGLAQRDRIHFTREGYDIKGKLFFNAFVNWFDQFAYAIPHDEFIFSDHGIKISDE